MDGTHWPQVGTGYVLCGPRITPDIEITEYSAPTCPRCQRAIRAHVRKMRRRGFRVAAPPGM